MFEPKERMIGEQFAVLIANDDFTGLTDAECASYQDWSEMFYNSYIVVEDNTTVWTRCDATGLDGECITVTIHRK